MQGRSNIYFGVPCSRRYSGVGMESSKHAPTYRRRFIDLVKAIESDPGTLVVPASEAFFQRAREFFGNRSDKSWSLTDCMSFVFMEDHNITEALTGDHYFAQAGFGALL